MARLAIEDKWFSDPRRSKLISLLGGEEIADGTAIKLWRLAQRFWGEDLSGIPIELFELIEAAPKLVQAKLVLVKDNHVFVRGSEEHLSWLYHKRMAAREGGKKSADRRKQKNGTAQPKKPEAAPKQTRSSAEADPKSLEPSGSGSGLGSKNYIYPVLDLTPVRLDPLAYLKEENHALLSKLSELDILNQRLRTNIEVVRTRFATVEELGDWMLGISECAGYKSKETIHAKKQYMKSSLMREIGLIE